MSPFNEAVAGSPTEQAHGSRRECGIAAYAKIFDVPEDQVITALVDLVGLPFAEEALESAGGTAWSHPSLTDRERSLAIVTALATAGVFGHRLNTHLDLARRNGLDDEALSALMTLLAGYIGYARASLAMEIIHHTSQPACSAP